MRLTWLPDVIRDAGLTVVTLDGWHLRGQAFPGSINGIVCHHTATPASAPGDYPTLRIVRDGRSDLPGPLAQLGLGRSGTVYVIASGRANHAGVGHWPGILGNADTIGIEAEHPGTTSHPWPVPQLAAYYRLCAALADHLELPTSRIIGHKEWAPGRKIDPIALDMHAFRRSIDAIREERHMSDHRHTPMPSELPRKWADESWKTWVARSGTDPSTRAWTFYREDLSWVYDRVIHPLEKRVAELEKRVAELERRPPGSVYGAVVKLAKP